jgi:DNA-binding protein H-NS
VKMESLEALNDDELRAVVARAEELLAQHDRQRKNEALEHARAILAGAGLNLRDVASGKAGNGHAKAPAYHGGRQYQHPTDKTKVWAAKGQKPQWVRELEAEGRRPIELPANNEFPAIKKTG